MRYNHNKAVVELAPHEKPLTATDLKALAWAVRRAAENSGTMMMPSTMFGITNAQVEQFHKHYALRVRAARAALRKVRELKGQGL